MRDTLGDILGPYEAAGDEAARDLAEAAIWREHGHDAAAFVLDVSGFTRGIAASGLVAQLARLHRLLMATVPVIRGHGGRTVKHDADNCYAAFASVEAAVAAAGDCLALLAGNGASGSVGIAYGPILLTERDFFGYPVNIASKLGEDLAGAGEILIDGEAAAMLSDDSRADAVERVLTASGVDIVAVVMRSMS